MLIDFDVLPEGTTVVNQLPGVSFPGSPTIIRPQLGTSSGVQALSNLQPGEEFDTEPLTVLFDAPQTSVRLHTGIETTSSGPISVTLTAFDGAEQAVAVDGPIMIGPGPMTIRTAMGVAVDQPSIERVTLHFTNAFAEVIDQLEFDSVGVATVDSEPPLVVIVAPLDGATVTGDSFMLEARITEAQKLREVRLSVGNDSGVTSLPISFSGAVPDYRISPVRTFAENFALGANTVTLAAEDWGGNVTSAEVTVTRVPVAGRIELPDNVITVRRGSSGDLNPIEVRLVETFEGSLAGRGDIRIQTVDGGPLRGSALLRDPLNDPDPMVRLALRASPRAPLGVSCLTVEAREVDTERLLDVAELAVSVIPGTAVTCDRDTTPLYAAVPQDELSAAINVAVDALVAADDRVEKLTPLRLTYTNGTLAISQRYRVHHKELTFVEANINLSSELAVRVDGRRLALSWQPYRVNAAPNLPVVSLGVAALWLTARAVFEAKFTASFKDRFLDELASGLNDRITDVHELAGSFLRDVRVRPNEFSIGFCVPNQVFPRPECGPGPRPGPGGAPDPGVVTGRRVTSPRTGVVRRSRRGERS